MKISVTFLEQMNEIFYDKSITIFTVVPVKDELGEVRSILVERATAKVNIQPSTSSIMRKEFGKEYTDALRLSCVVNLIGKDDVIRYGSVDYNVLDIGNWESHQVIMIGRR